MPIERTVPMLLAISAIALILILLLAGPLLAVVFIAGWTLGWLA